MTKLLYDRLDKYALAAIAVLALLILFLVGQELTQPKTEGPSEEERKAAQAQLYFDPNFEKKISLVKKMLVGGSLDSAEELVTELVLDYPYDGMPYMLKGDIQLRRQDVVQAALAYRNAVDLNPDFLDKKATDFQGKKIKRTVEEALTEIEKAQQAGNNSEELKENRNAMYYMMRKIAGSCS